MIQRDTTNNSMNMQSYCCWFCFYKKRFVENIKSKWQSCNDLINILMLPINHWERLILDDHYFQVIAQWKEGRLYRIYFSNSSTQHIYSITTISFERNTICPVNDLHFTHTIFDGRNRSTHLYKTVVVHMDNRQAAYKDPRVCHGDPPDIIMEVVHSHTSFSCTINHTTISGRESVWNRGCNLLLARSASGILLGLLEISHHVYLTFS